MSDVSDKEIYLRVVPSYLSFSFLEHISLTYTFYSENMFSLEKYYTVISKQINFVSTKFRKLNSYNSRFSIYSQTKPELAPIYRQNKITPTLLRPSKRFNPRLLMHGGPFFKTAGRSGPNISKSL